MRANHHLQVPAAQLSPLVREHGHLVVTDARIYFQPLHNVSGEGWPHVLTELAWPSGEKYGESTTSRCTTSQVKVGPTVGQHQIDSSRVCKMTQSLNFWSMAPCWSQMCVHASSHCAAPWIRMATCSAGGLHEKSPALEWHLITRVMHSWSGVGAETHATCPTCLTNQRAKLLVQTW